MDLQLDLNHGSATFGDLFMAGGDLTTVDSQAAILQNAVTQIRTFLGECFMDSTVGIDYFNKVLVKNPNQGDIDAILLSRLSNVAGVIRVLTYAFTADFVNRALMVNFTLQTTIGVVSYAGTVGA